MGRSQKFSIFNVRWHEVSAVIYEKYFENNQSRYSRESLILKKGINKTNYL